MTEYDYTKSADYWVAFGDAALKQLKHLKKKKRTPAIYRATILTESNIKETMHRLIELGAEPEVWSKYMLDDE